MQSAAIAYCCVYTWSALSSPTEQKCLPSVLNATSHTWSVWLSNVCTTSVRRTSHSFTFLSLDPVTICVPSGEASTASTHDKWPLNECTKDAECAEPADTSGAETRPSSEALYNTLPSGENTSDR